MLLTIWRILFPTSVFVDRNSSDSTSCCVLFRLVPGAAVVKGLNTLSAWALQNGLLAGKQVREEIRNLFFKKKRCHWDQHDTTRSLQTITEALDDEGRNDKEQEGRLTN